MSVRPDSLLFSDGFSQRMQLCAHSRSFDETSEKSGLAFFSELDAADEKVDDRLRLPLVGSANGQADPVLWT